MDHPALFIYVLFQLKFCNGIQLLLKEHVYTLLKTNIYNKNYK